jgi:hypothetical protein
MTGQKEVLKSTGTTGKTGRKRNIKKIAQDLPQNRKGIDTNKTHGYVTQERRKKK